MFDLVTKQASTIKRLCLGVERVTAHRYAKHGWLSTDGYFRQRTSLAIRKGLMRSMEEPAENEPCFTALKEIRFCGINLDHFMNDTFKPVIDCKRLKALRIESCLGLVPGLSHFLAFNTLKTPVSASRCMRLQSVMLRVEDLDPTVLGSLRAFLGALPPLKRLHILLDCVTTTDQLSEEVLERHGPSLESLVWDERLSSRSTDRESNFVSKDTFRKYISVHCVNLKALGISIDWKGMLPQRDERCQVCTVGPCDFIF